MNYLKTFLLMLTLMVLCVYAGQRIGGQNGAIMMFAFAAIMNVGTYWFSDKAVIAMHRAREVTAREAPALHRSVLKLSQLGNIPMPRVYIYEDDSPNAFATGRNMNHAAVACSTGILELLSPAELEGVLAHELSHIKHYDMLIGTVAAVTAGGLMMLSHMARWAMIFGGGMRDRDDDRGGNGLSQIALILLAPIAASIIQLMISRSREFAADEGSAALTGDPAALVRALRKIHGAHEEVASETATPAVAHMYIANPFGSEGLLASLFSTHPTLAKRVNRLEKISEGRIRPSF